MRNIGVIIKYVPFPEKKLVHVSISLKNIGIILFFFHSFKFIPGIVLFGKRYLTTLTCCNGAFDHRWSLSHASTISLISKRPKSDSSSIIIVIKYLFFKKSNSFALGHKKFDIDPVTNGSIIDLQKKKPKYVVYEPQYTKNKRF